MREPKGEAARKAKAARKGSGDQFIIEFRGSVHHRDQFIPGVYECQISVDQNIVKGDT